MEQNYNFNQEKLSLIEVLIDKVEKITIELKM